MPLTRLVLVLSIAWPLAAIADADAPKDLSSPAYRAEVAERFPSIEGEDIEPAAVPGLYQVFKDGAVGYLTQDGRYLIDGDLIDLRTDTNLSDHARRAWRRDTLGSVKESQMIAFGPEQPERTVSIFTDVNCHYCRHLHKNIDRITAAGIRVRYLAYPLPGPGTDAYKKARAVWCAEDRQKAMTRAKQGKSVAAEPGCDSPVDSHYKLASVTLGLRGTPSIVTDSGEILPPGLPIGELIERIKRKEKTEPDQ